MDINKHTTEALRNQAKQKLVSNKLKCFARTQKLTQFILDSTYNATVLMEIQKVNSKDETLESKVWWEQTEFIKKQIRNS